MVEAEEIVLSTEVVIGGITYGYQINAQSDISSIALHKDSMYISLESQILSFKLNNLSNPPLNLSNVYKGNRVTDPAFLQFFEGIAGRGEHQPEILACATKKAVIFIDLKSKAKGILKAIQKQQFKSFKWSPRFPKCLLLRDNSLIFYRVKIKWGQKTIELEQSEILKDDVIIDADWGPGEDDVTYITANDRQSVKELKVVEVSKENTIEGLKKSEHNDRIMEVLKNVLKKGLEQITEACVKWLSNNLLFLALWFQSGTPQASQTLIIILVEGEKVYYKEVSQNDKKTCDSYCSLVKYKSTDDSELIVFAQRASEVPIYLLSRHKGGKWTLYPQSIMTKTNEQSTVISITSLEFVPGGQASGLSSDHLLLVWGKNMSVNQIEVPPPEKEPSTEEAKVQTTEQVVLTPSAMKAESTEQGVEEEPEDDELTAQTKPEVVTKKATAKPQPKTSISSTKTDKARLLKILIFSIFLIVIISLIVAFSSASTDNLTLLILKILLLLLFYVSFSVFYYNLRHRAGV